jgi:hypothetical protein
LKPFYHSSRAISLLKAFLFCVIILNLHRGSAQEYNSLGSWNILNIKYNLSENWSLFGEAQLRSLDFYSDFHYYEMKSGVNYKPSSNLTLSFAGGVLAP